jgi:hypothetical protein
LTNISVFSACSLNCSSGILDAANCRCCDFADFNKYTSLKTELTKVEKLMSTQTVTAELQSQINSLKKSIADTEAAVIGSCGSTAAETISGYFEFAGSNLHSLNVSLETFQFVYNPSKCKLKCDGAKGFVLNKKRCECIFFQGYEEVNSIYDKYYSWSFELAKTNYDVVEFQEVKRAWNKEYSNTLKTIESLEMNWDNYTFEQKHAMINELKTKREAFAVRINAYMNSPPGNCGIVCEYSSIAEAANNCQCDNSTTVKDYYKNFAIFLDTEFSIINTGSKQYDKTPFLSKMMEVRKKGSLLYSGISRDGISAEEKRSRADAFIAEHDALRAEWLVFKAKLDEPSCSLTCSGDTVKRCNPCECSVRVG